MKKIVLIINLLLVLFTSLVSADVIGHLTVTWTNVYTTYYTVNVCIEDASIFGTFNQMIIEYTKDEHISPPSPKQDSFSNQGGNKWCSALSSASLWDSAPLADTLDDAMITVKEASCPGGICYQDSYWSTDTPVGIDDTNHIFYGGNTSGCTKDDDCNNLDTDCADGVCTSNVCQQNYKPSTTECRSASGDCDLAETCTGSSADCPADIKSTAQCRASAGDCDVAEVCNGVDNDCPTDVFLPDTTVCRASGGVCDLEEKCTGSSALCPDDQVKPAATECRGVAGVCDLAEVCDGSSKLCPIDTKSTAECRASAGDCDVAENCDGQNNDCPADAKAPAGTECGQARDCPADACNGYFAEFYPTDGQDTCDGNGTCVEYSCALENKYCTDNDGADGINTLECNAPCDQNSDCPGSSCNLNTCQCTNEICDNSIDDDGDTLIDCADSDCAGQQGPSGVTCCQNNDNCNYLDTDCADGVCTSNVCQQNYKPSTTECRAASGDCDLAETCTGSSATCPADAKSTAQCRAASGDCDVAESCNGVDNTCPVDAYQPSSTVCRSSAGACDLEEKCTGSSATCPADTKSTAQCRASTGDCDVAEVCNGIGNDCPADVFLPDTFVCRTAIGVCDLEEKCTGNNATCPSDSKSTAQCRASAGDCDTAENCDGINNNCPADVFQPSTTVCRVQNGTCDLEEKCTGTDALCPVDTYQPPGTDCGICAACNGLGNCTYDGTQDNDCSNTICPDACGLSPDNNPFTWDYADDIPNDCVAIFTCSAYECSYNHKCSVDSCLAACDATHQCPDTNCDNLDGCIGNNYRDYANVTNTCKAECTCTNNTCTLAIIYIDDPRCATQFNISLKQGWNLISIPLILNNNSVDSVFELINYSYLFSYDLGWKVPTKINNTFGYWIKVSNDDTLTVDGLEPENALINLNNGWNLVGYPYVVDKNVGDLYADNVVYSYNGSWSSYIPNRTFNSLQTLKPGFGYWINKK